MYLFFLFWERDLNWFWTAKQLEAMYIYVYIYINTCLSPFPVIVTKEDFYTFCRGSRTKLNLHLPLLLAIGTTLYVWCIYIIYDIHILCSLYIYIYIVEDVYIYIYIIRNVHIYIYNPRTSAMKELNTLSAQQSVTTLQQVWPWEDAHEAWVETLGGLEVSAERKTTT